jgi:predicted nucleic acid-binding protein
MTDVLIDTSAWITFFRSGLGPVADEVARLVQADRAWLTGVVLAELLRGTRTVREKTELDALLSVVPYAETERADWERAGEFLRTLRTRGLSVPLSDAVIAAVAERRGLAVLALDRHFDELPARRWTAG